IQPPLTRPPPTDFVFLTFCVEDSRELEVKFEKDKMIFSCKGPDKTSYLNEVNLFEKILPQVSLRSYYCTLNVVSSSRPHLSTQKQRLMCVCAVILQVKWLALDFENWKDWEEDSDNDGENFDQFSDIMNKMGGDDLGVPDMDGLDDVSML
uniref:Prostaglandin E synthase 3 n=1 Tax=Eptatretus burgeri TaxID=7764 RepID=A0A8C4QM93_EPTBU